MIVEIKNASLSHIEPLNQLFEQYLQIYQLKSVGTSSKKFLSERIKNNDAIIFIIFENQQAVGFCLVYPTFSSMAMKPIWVLNDLFIIANRRRQGLATKLIKYVEGEAANNHIFSIKLATRTNNSEANPLYVSLGYSHNDQFNLYSKKII